MLLDTQTFQRIQADVNVPSSMPNISLVNEEQDSDDNTTSEHEQDVNDILSQARTTELQHLSQIMLRDRPTQANEIINVLFELIGNIPESSSSMTTTTTTTYGNRPLNQVGTVSERDRPSADYGHLDRATLAQEFQFYLQPPATTNQTSSSSSSIRLHAKSFAITAWTDISKDLVMTEIKNEFGIENIQYVCIGEEISELNHRQHLHIQIILKEKIDRRKPFLDDITQTHCNYQVTRNDRAWNEYIRKGDDYIEFGDYQSVSSRGQKQWSAAAASSPSSSATSADQGPSTRGTTRTTTTTSINTRAQAEERRQLAKQAIELAEANVDSAMDFIRRSMPDKFLTQSSWYVLVTKSF